MRRSVSTTGERSQEACALEAYSILFLRKRCARRLHVGRPSVSVSGVKLKLKHQRHVSIPKPRVASSKLPKLNEEAGLRDKLCLLLHQRPLPTRVRSLCSNVASRAGHKSWELASSS